jgi:hypothetical protein
MQTTLLDSDLKEMLAGEHSIPPELDESTKQRMRTVAEKEQYRLSVLLVILSFLLTLSEMAVFLPLIADTALKMCFIMLNGSIISFLIFFYTTTYKTQNRKENLLCHYY